MPIKFLKKCDTIPIYCTTHILKMLNIVNYIERTPRSYWNVHAIHHQSVNEKMCPKKCHLSWMDDKNSEKSCKYFFCHHNWRKREQSGREFWGEGGRIHTGKKFKMMSSSQPFWKSYVINVLGFWIYLRFFSFWSCMFPTMNIFKIKIQQNFLQYSNF